jgi:hypothetical protein
MQVFSLPRHVIRTGALASRIAAKSLSNEAAIRDDAVRRWKGVRAAGLSSDEAARAVGVSRATLYRWAKRPEPQSRRPRRRAGRDGVRLRPSRGVAGNRRLHTSIQPS